ncbi:hypothetical protein GGH94_002215 [Coemansia aciculifera]|uniref:AB hydrolase-1 domain-containing protein n=1 Tax=Coemansia aciculifera TaxID=417176 RepID=A0A9W8ILJ7_9FUNG|nr:hypothetical protein GGH94_002215 [Coemansia aciculifera]
MQVARRIFDASRKGQRIVVNIYSATEAISSNSGEKTRLTLLLAHANGFHKELWEPTLERVFAHRSESWYIDQAIALDSYNHGDSAIANRSFIDSEEFSPWTENARDILAILAQLGSSRNIVGVGHSWGASSLLLAEIMAPSSFANLIITDPVLHSGSDQSANALAKLTLKRRYQWSTAEEARQYFNNHPFFRIWDQRIIDLHLRYGLEQVGEDESLILKCRPSNESAVYSGSRDDSPHAMQNLAKVQCPVAFLTGETSEQSPPTHIARITENMVDCRHVVMDDVGHLLLHQDPDRTADRYVEFLDGFVSKKPRPTANL